MSLTNSIMPSDYIYGIGNEVLTFAIVVISGLIPLFFFIIWKTDWRAMLNSVGTGHWWIFSEHRNPGANVQETGNRLENVEPGVHPIQNRIYNPERCPICLGEHQLALETNCGHLYCGSCLRTYIYMNGIMSRILCPMCRQQISVLFVCFTEQELQAAPTSTIGAETQLLYHMVDDYNRRFSGEPRSMTVVLVGLEQSDNHLKRIFMEMVRDCPTLMRHLWNEFFSVGGLMFMFRIRILLCFVAGLMYVFSPLDIIPEGVFGVLGLLDDIFVLFLLAMYISIIYRRLVVSRRMAT